MNIVEMEALDSFHASHAEPSELVAGKTFTINAAEAEQLEKSGLAKPKAGTARKAAK